MLAFTLKGVLSIGTVLFSCLIGAVFYWILYFKMVPDLGVQDFAVHLRKNGCLTPILQKQKIASTVILTLKLPQNYHEQTFVTLSNTPVSADENAKPEFEELAFLPHQQSSMAKFVRDFFYSGLSSTHYFRDEEVITLNFQTPLKASPGVVEICMSPRPLLYSARIQVAPIFSWSVRNLLAKHPLISFAVYETVIGAAVSIAAAVAFLLHAKNKQS